ncbi:MAG: hypothetical protein BWK75_00405 [Candidatus Altiarchaeales archaeon A3]|nr:MAG: hypothetical protein BWK75_00405 [Candidatus Altiarchaeales archaeon A3]
MITKKFLALGILIIIFVASTYVIFETPQNKINEDTTLSSNKNNSNNQNISLPMETKEYSECRKQECPKVECPKCPEKIDGGKMIYIETRLNNTGNANLSNGRIKFYLNDAMKVESSLNNTFILNSSMHDKATIIYDVNYSCEKCKECPPCECGSCYCTGCPVCPKTEQCNISNVSECRNDTIPDFAIIFDDNTYYEGDLVKANVTSNRIVYFNSWVLYKKVNNSFNKVDETNGSGIVNCTTLEWSKSLDYGDYLLGFCYSLVENDFIDCIYKGFEVEIITGFDWPMLHHDPQHTRYSESPAPDTNRTKWIFDMGNLTGASPIIADDIVFAVTLYGAIYALNKSNGEVIWNHTISGYIHNAPAVDKNIVFVGSSIYPDTIVYALNKSTGELIWNHTIICGGDRIFSPTVVGDKVFIGTKGYGSDACFDKYVNMLALNKLTGDVIWDYTVDDWIYTSPAVSNSMVFVSSYNGKLYAFNESNGYLLWKYPTGDLYSSPMVINESIFFNSWKRKYINSSPYLTSTIYSLNVSDGNLIWNYTTSGGSSQPLSYGYHKVFVELNNYVYAFNESNGELIWNYSVNGYCTSPAVADGIVFVSSTGKTIYALNASNGNLIWRYDTADTIMAPLAIANGMVFISSYNGKLYAFG